MNLSEHITLDQGTFSQTATRAGIENYPNIDQVEAMKLVSEHIIEPALKTCPTTSISSFFRCEKLNASIGGASSSQHCKGEAVDLVTKGQNKDLFYWIKNNLEFDQLIWEFGSVNSPAWVHVSYVEHRTNRRQVLRAYKDSTGTHYKPFDL